MNLRKEFGEFLKIYEILDMIESEISKQICEIYVKVCFEI